MKHSIIILAIVLTSCNSKSNREFMNESIDLINRKDYDNAILLLNTALENDPSNIELNIQKGIVYELKRQPDSAWMTYYRLVNLKPNNSAGFYYKGLNESAKGDFFNADISFTNALKTKGYSEKNKSIGAEFILDTNNEWGIEGDFEVPASKIFYERGINSYKMDSISDAHSDFTNAIEYQYNLGSSLYMRGLCYLQYNYLEKACSYFSKAVLYGDSLGKVALLNYCK